jgi:hypothetical protein
VRPFTSLVDPGDIYPPHPWHGRSSFLLHQEILQSLGVVLNDLHHHAEPENKQKPKA